MQVIQLDQTYFGKLPVKSTLHVHYNYNVRKAPDKQAGADADADAGGSLEIERFEERWNGVPLLWALPFMISRRINGILSYAATPVVLRS